MKMLSIKQIEKFKMDCAVWLEGFLKSNSVCPIKEVYTAGKRQGFTRAQIKAARAWQGKWITTVDENAWGWDVK